MSWRKWQLCDGCNRPQLVDDLGIFHSHPGVHGVECDGSGKSGPELRQVIAADQHHKNMAIALSQFLMLVDSTGGTYADLETPWAEHGFVEGARAALFDAVQADPQLLAGTSLVVSPLTESSEPAGLLAGPLCETCEKLAQPVAGFDLASLPDPLGDSEGFKHRYPCVLLPVDDSEGDQ